MSFLMKDKKFYISLLAISLPIAMQNLISFTVGMMDTVMLGALGEITLSASSLANQPGFVFNIAMFGIGSGAMVLNAQYWGRGEMEPVRRVFGVALKLALTLALLLTATVCVFPEQVMRIFTPEAVIIAEGVKYLKIIALSYLFVGYSVAMTVSLRSIEVVRVSVIVSISSLAINVLLNYMLIFGKFGAPALGIRGAAIATVIARFSECVIITVYLVFVDKRLQLTWKHVVSLDKALLADYARYAAPVVLGEVLWSLGMAVHSMILGRLGEDAVAANAICSVAQQFVTVFVFGVANACGVIIGKTIGGGDVKLAHRYAKTMQFCFIGLGVVCALTMFLLKDAVISIYNISEGTRLLTRQFLIVNSFAVFALAYTAPSLVGILRGGGDSRFVLFLDLIFVWGVTIPLGIFAGLIYGLPLPVVYLCLKCDEPLKVIFTALRLRGTKWIQNVTRAEFPLEE